MNYKDSKLHGTIHRILADAGISKAPVLGDPPPIVDHQKMAPQLLSGLEQLQGSDKHLIGILVTLICLLFLMGLGLVIYYRDDPARVSLVLGGNYLSLLVIVGFLRRIWLEKRTIDALLIIVAGLKPADASKTLIDFHFRSMQAKGKFVEGTGRPVPN